MHENEFWMVVEENKMAISSSKSVDAEQIFELLLLDIERPINLVKDLLSEDNVAS